jgi:hypothetical protein
LKYRRREVTKAGAACEIFVLIRLCVIAGRFEPTSQVIDIVRVIQAPKQNPSNPLRLLGFFINLVAGTGFEPVTFRL